MQKLRVGLLILFSVILFVSTVTAETTTSLEGNYIAKGTTAKGTAYTANVVIKRNGDVYPVSWLLDGSGEQYQGIGILKEDIFSVAWGAGAGVGVVSYKLNANKLDGVWATLGSASYGTEVLTKK